MVRPVKISDFPSPSLNSRKIAKKIIRNAELLLENDVKKPKTKSQMSKGGKNISPIPEMTSSPPSVKKMELTNIDLTPKDDQMTEKPLESGKIDGKIPIMPILKKQKTRSVLTKNRVPIIPKSDQITVKNTLKREKIKNPPPEKFFKPEGRTLFNKNKIYAQNFDKNEKFASEKVITTQVEKSPYLGAFKVSKMNQINSQKNIQNGQNQQKTKTKIPSKKGSNLQKDPVSNLSPRSDEIDFKNIKHNDSFVLSAKKLGSRRGSRRPKPEVIRLYKRKENSKMIPELNKKLKSCLKKNSELRTSDQVMVNSPSGEGKNVVDSDGNNKNGKNSTKRSQIPRLSKEIGVVAM